MRDAEEAAEELASSRSDHGSTAAATSGTSDAGFDPTGVALTVAQTRPIVGDADRRQEVIGEIRVHGNASLTDEEVAQASPASRSAQPLPPTASTRSSSA